MMHAASRQALTSLRPSVEESLGGLNSVEDHRAFSAELYSIARVLAAQPRLRRMLADAAAAADARTALVGALLDNKVSAAAVDLVKAAVALRWSSPWDLLDAIEWAGDDVLLAAAEQADIIEAVEDELFRLERILDNESNLTALLDEQSATPERRRELLDSVVGQKVQPVTLALLQHAVASQRKTSILLAIDDLIESAAKRRERSVARVVSPIVLSDEQQQHLADALSHLYGRRIDVRYAVDPTLLGGLVVHVGDEVIDGSIAARFVQARNAFAR